MALGKLAQRAVNFARRFVPKRRLSGGDAAALLARLDSYRAQFPECSLPDLAGGRWVSLDAYRWWGKIRVRPNTATGGNWLFLCRGALASSSITVHIESRQRDNLIVIGPAARFSAQIRLQGSGGCVALAGGTSWRCELDIRLSSDHEALLWGAGCTSNGATLIAEGEGRSIVIGDDCMLAPNTRITTSDLHGIADLATGEWLNPPADVLLGRHVWVGQNASIAKGARIGAGSVIGAHSLVTRTIPLNSIAAGVPARCIREGVEWVRERKPGAP